jgi:Zn-dependent peptidase ImmA (M78 family)
VRSQDVVIYNPRHSDGRQASDIAHELAHIILGHTPGKIVLSQDGAMVMRSYDPQQEEEANWLGWTILLPREALAAAVRVGLSTSGIAQRYGVSEQLVEYRIRMTGANRQFGRRRHRSA